MEWVNLWYKRNDKTMHYEYNHYEPCFGPQDLPTPNSEEQRRAWTNKHWISNRALLLDGKIIELNFMRP